MPFDKVLIANRGEIARRIQRTCHELGYRTVAVYSDADFDAPFVREADEAVRLGPPPAAESYLAIDRILAAARATGAGAIHPGYGFLAENADFAEACEKAGIVFVGPTSQTIRVMGSKIAAKRLMQEHGVPVIPGYDGAEQAVEALAHHARQVGFPVLLKASAGGGGKGMRIVRSPDALTPAIEAAKREAAAAFGDDTLLLERYLDRPRHIEFQILGDTHGQVLHCFERECSIQRRHQKVVEETPCVLLQAHPELRDRMAGAAVRAGVALDYRSAGTVEFIVSPELDFYFLEVNTRLQVEHPVTEATTGLDLVKLQLLVAEGHPLPVEQLDLEQVGHAIECRVYAEDPGNDFLPSTGTLHAWSLPTLEGLRVDSGVEAGSQVPVFYDPLLAKFVTWGSSREEATRLMLRALEQSVMHGVVTNRRFLVELLRTEAWAVGDLHTHFIEEHAGHDLVAPKAPPRRVHAAAIALTLHDALARHPVAATLPGLRPGWRNNRWRDVEQVWEHVELGGARQTVEVRYRAGQAAADFVVTVGDEAERDAAFREWLGARYGTTEALREAWATPKRKGLREDETLDTVERLPTPMLRGEKYGDARMADTEAFAQQSALHVRVGRSGGGSLFLQLGGAGEPLGQATTYHVTAHGEQRWVHAQGWSMAFERRSRFPMHDTFDAARGARAPMPGKVSRVLVAVGDAVEAGQALVVLEAMKMELTVKADVAGVVAQVFVEEGQLVDADAALVALETS